jgi:hypothetical protein
MSGTPGGIRTHAGAILSRLSLPLDYRGSAVNLPVGKPCRRTQYVIEHLLREPAGICVLLTRVV